ncbi:MAG: methyltransferase [Planctomycetales bacterium]|nr:methyltransferase [Planctomycetales bacterium]
MNTQSAQALELPPLPSEQLLIEHLPPWQGENALVVSPGRSQLASATAEANPGGQVTAYYLDLFDATATLRFWTQAIVDSPLPFQIACGADLPDERLDLFAFAVLKRGEAELTRDWLQQAHQLLNIGGCMAVSVDNPKDTWLHDQMRSMFRKVTAIRKSEGCVFIAYKDVELKKQRDFSCQFSFRDEQHVIQVVSRPGVFSHRKLDNGARQLLNVAEIGEEDRVIDMGCGCGTVALGAACRTRKEVIGVDSNARAVECLINGARLNGLENVHGLHNCDGQFDLESPVDLVLANPPYYGDNTIAQHFVDAALANLRSGGALLTVAKQTSWLEDYMQIHFEDVQVIESGSYRVVCGRRP